MEETAVQATSELPVGPEQPVATAMGQMKSQPTRSENGVVSMTGASVVVLADGDQRHTMGSVPPGTYDILATFPGREPMNAGRVVVGKGAEVVLACSPVFTACAVE